MTETDTLDDALCAINTKLNIERDMLETKVHDLTLELDALRAHGRVVEIERDKANQRAVNYWHVLRDRLCYVMIVWQDEMQEWLEHNCKGKHEIMNGAPGRENYKLVVFEKEDDGALFKMFFF